MFTHHHLLVRDMKNAKRVLWFAMLLEFFLIVPERLSLDFVPHALLLSAFGLLIVAFYYLLFQGFARLSKHYHAGRLYWYFVANFMIGVFLFALGVIDRIAGYDALRPAGDVLGVGLLIGAVFTFLYGYLVMDLPERIFGRLLFGARATNIGKALVMSAIVTLAATSDVPLAENSLLSSLALVDLLLLVVANAIDYSILARAIEEVEKPRARPAPVPS